MPGRSSHLPLLSAESEPMTRVLADLGPAPDERASWDPELYISYNRGHE